MISSRERAPRYGPGRLLVDGADDRLCRKAMLTFRPTARQERSLLGLLGVLAEVYNAGLQERSDAWRQAGRRIRLFDQFNQITQLRGVRDDVLAWGVQPLRSALRRLDEAYSSFYRRCAKGQAPGHPRFKSASRFDTACWDEPAGWAVDLVAGTLRVQGVGTIRLAKGALSQLDRLAARGGVPVTLTVTRRRSGGGWSARALVARYGVVVLEDLNLKNMARSARGTKENPGTNVAAKQALNRKLADAALGRLRHWVCVKAEEAGRRTWAVNPANTSRTCAPCGHCAPQNRRSRDQFRCTACGHEAHADLNAAENIAARGQACETVWRTAGSPPLPRPKPRLRRGTPTVEPATAHDA